MAHKGTFVWGEVGDSPHMLHLAWQDNIGKWKMGYGVTVSHVPYYFYLARTLHWDYIQLLQ